MGNITAMVDASQHLVDRYSYDPFGNPIAKNGPLAEANLYQFSSKEIYPNSGFYYYGFRFYDPNWQRWLNRDPLGEGGGISLYQFVDNNSISMVDTWGLICCIADDTEDEFDQRLDMVGRGGLFAAYAYNKKMRRSNRDQAEQAKCEIKQFAKEVAKETAHQAMVIAATEGVGQLLKQIANLTKLIKSASGPPSEAVASFAQSNSSKLFSNAAKTAPTPRFLVTESGVAVPTSAAELKSNLQLLQDVSTKPATSRTLLGTDSQGPLRVRVEQANPSTPGYTGPIDPLHTVDHLHIDRRLNGTTGPWQSSEKLPYDWPF